MNDINPNGARIRLVCFDLGGVLVRICRSWDEGCARAGLDVRSNLPPGATFHDRNRIVIDYQTDRIDRETFARTISEHLKGAYSPEEICRVHEAWVIEQYEGVEDVIDCVHAVGLTTACLSNTNESHWSEMPRYPAFNKLGVRLASHELGAHKPDVEIFRKAEQALGVRGHEILFFEDLPDNIAGAREAGWNAVLIDHTKRTDVQMMQALTRARVLRES